MRYVISDIHGCYDEYISLISKLDLTEMDELYILGDALDRGPEPIRVIKDIMNRNDAVYILGNHDYLFLYFVGKLGVELSCASELTREDTEDFKLYLEDGGFSTIKKYMQLTYEEKKDIQNYLLNAESFCVLGEDEEKYILVHAGIANFREDMVLDKCDILDFIFDSIDYSKRYYQNKNIHIITGHTPTMYIRNDSKPELYKENGHIAIDCGCVYGGRLAAYCIETGEVIYEDSLANYL